MTAPCGSPRASNRTQFGESIRSSSVSSMATIRSSSGSSAMRVFRSVSFPLPWPRLFPDRGVCLVYVTHQHGYRR